MSVSIWGVIVDIILFFIIAGNAVIGYRRGLAKVIYSFVSSLAVIILVLILYRPITNYIINNTNASEKLENVFEEKLGYLFEKEEIENTEQLQEDDNMSSILKIFVGNEMGTLLQETKDSVIVYLSIQISHKVISVLVFFILFAGIRLLVYILGNYIDMVANLPIIRVFNGSGGMILGVIRGFFVIYIVLGLLSLVMPIINSAGIIIAIKNAPIGGKMFENNILLNLIFKFI